VLSKSVSGLKVHTFTHHKLKSNVFIKSYKTANYGRWYCKEDTAKPGEGAVTRNDLKLDRKKKVELVAVAGRRTWKFDLLKFFR
jgi:hypothetical protein